MLPMSQNCPLLVQVYLPKSQEKSLHLHKASAQNDNPSSTSLVLAFVRLARLCPAQYSVSPQFEFADATVWSWS